MKKILLISLLTLALVGCGTSAQGEREFDKTKDITLVSREDGSGTRGAFIELVGIEEKDGNGNKVDRTSQEAIIANKTDVMMQNITSDMNAIGYISLGSLNDTLKALEVDGVSPSVENIQSGSYKVARPFNVVFGDILSDVAQDFMDYILSKDGQSVVSQNGYISVETTSEYTTKNLKGKIVIAGSSSVSPLMEKIAEAYQALNESVTIEIQTTDSTVGVLSAIDGTVDIGMASRNLKDDELSQINHKAIAIDGIVVVVNNDNPLTNVSSEDLKEIYLGNIKTWETLISE